MRKTNLFACHAQIAGRRTSDSEEEDEGGENGAGQVGPVVARHMYSRLQQVFKLDAASAVVDADVDADAATVNTPNVHFSRVSCR